MTLRFMFDIVTAHPRASIFGRFGGGGRRKSLIFAAGSLRNEGGGSWRLPALSPPS
jgi:hypothetical protein